MQANWTCQAGMTGGGGGGGSCPAHRIFYLVNLFKYYQISHFRKLISAMINERLHQYTKCLEVILFAVHDK